MKNILIFQVFLVLFYFVTNCMYLSVIETLPVFEVITTANVVKKK